MSKRIIPCRVTGEYVRGAGVAVGAAGSHHDVVLELTFDQMWDGTTKSITWLDANGENSVITILTADMMRLIERDTDETGEAEPYTAYHVEIPAEPKAVSGSMTMTIKGVETDGEGTETRATLSTSCTFTVLPSAYDAQGAEAGDITPTQAEQLQAQIDAILADIAEAAAAADAKEAAEAAAIAAAQSASIAQAAASGASGSMSAAQAAQIAAAASEAAADASSVAAIAAQIAAETAADTATSKATEAENSAADALASAQAAASSEIAAAASAAAAEASKSAATAAQAAAQAAAFAAEQSAQDAEDKRTQAESWAVGGTDTRPGEDTNNAKYWSDRAQDAAGGGVTSFKGRNGAVEPMQGDYTAAMVGADPSGSAASAAQAASQALSQHNNDAQAHGGVFATKADLADGTLAFTIGRDSTGPYIEY